MGYNLTLSDYLKYFSKGFGIALYVYSLIIILNDKIMLYLTKYLYSKKEVMLITIPLAIFTIILFTINKSDGFKIFEICCLKNGSHRGCPRVDNNLCKDIHKYISFIDGEISKSLYPTFYIIVGIFFIYVLIRIIMISNNLVFNENEKNKKE